MRYLLRLTVLSLCLLFMASFTYAQKTTTTPPAKKPWKPKAAANAFDIDPDLETVLIRSSQSPHERGMLVQDKAARSGWALKSDPATDRPGPGGIWFGYTYAQDAGKARVYFRLKVADNSSPEPVVTLRTNIHNSELKDVPEAGWRQFDIRGTDFKTPNVYQEFAVDFVKGERGFGDFAVGTYGRTTVSFDGLRVEQLSRFSVAEMMKLLRLPDKPANLALSSVPRVHEAAGLYRQLWGVEAATRLLSPGKEPEYNVSTLNVHPQRTRVDGFPERWEDVYANTVIVLNNVPLKGISTVGATMLRDWVQNGGTLLLMGDTHGPVSGNWANSPLGILLPVDFPASGRTIPPARPVRLQLPAGAVVYSPRVHPAVVRPGSRVVLQGSKREPLIVEKAAGKGRVVVLLLSVFDGPDLPDNSNRTAVRWWEWQDWPSLLASVLKGTTLQTTGRQGKPNATMTTMLKEEANSVIMETSDVRPLQDATRLLANPHKGWYHHILDNGTWGYHVDKETDITDFPGMDHLYVRLSWAHFEPEEGKFDWHWIDDQVVRWVTRGYGLSLRFSTKETDSSKPYATPKWVVAAGAKGQMSKSFGADCWRPDYGDPVFLDKLAGFVRAAATRYDGKPWLRYVDIGIGTWGEGHDLNDAGLIPLDALEKHVAIYRAAFTKSQLILSDDAYHYHSRPDDQKARLKKLCEEQGIGWRDDSVLVPWYVQHESHRNCVVAPELYRDSFRERPVVLELDHYGTVKKEGVWKGQDGAEAGADLVRGAIRDMRATYIGYHGDAADWRNDNPHLARELVNLCGYWFFPEQIELPKILVPGKTARLRLTIKNQGVAPAYEPYELRLKVESGGKVVTTPLGKGCRDWLPGQSVTSEFTFVVPENLPTGKGAVAIGLFDKSGDKERPVELALKIEQRDPDGYYQLPTGTMIAADE